MSLQYENDDSEDEYMYEVGNTKASSSKASPHVNVQLVDIDSLFLLVQVQQLTSLTKTCLTR